MIKEYLKDDGSLVIIDTQKEYFLQNVILDIIWYRFVIPRYEIWFSKSYRDYGKVLTDLGFVKINNQTINEKEVSLWKKKL